jgi:hypothetical protein
MCFVKSCLSGESGCVVVGESGLSRREKRKRRGSAGVKVNLGWEFASATAASHYRQAPHLRQSQVTSVTLLGATTAHSAT